MIESLQDAVKPIVLFMYPGIAYEVFRKQGIECIVFPYIKLHLFPQKYSWKQRLRHPSHFRIVTLYRVEKACVKNVKEYLGDRHIDIVHSNYSSLLIGRELSVALKAKHVWHIREFLEKGVHVPNRPFGGYTLLKALINRADARIVVSHPVQAHWGFKKKNTWIIPPAIAKASDCCYYSDKEPYILFCSYWITRSKGAIDTIEAYGRSGLHRDGIRMSFVGNCTEEIHNGIMDIAKRYGCEDSVDFYPCQDDVKPFFAHAKAFVMGSTNEGLGRVTAEAMFYGCPVVARASGGTMDLIRDGVTGYLFHTLDECASLLRNVCLEPQESLILSAQASVVNKLSIEAGGARIMEVYHTVLGQGKEHSVRLAEPSVCTGCGVCSTVCSTGSIRMKEGHLGHLFPSVNQKICIKCGLCERVCPVLHPLQLRSIQTAYASWSKDSQEYRTSTSGGIAAELSKHILRLGGVVYGCAMLPDVEVRHVRVDREEDLTLLKSSKYVQSSIVGIIPSLKQDVTEGRHVLFIGTPCQVAAVKALYKNQPEKLYLVDLVCHGTPSLKLLKATVHQAVPGKKCTNVTFRVGNRYSLRVWDEDRLLYEMPQGASHYRSTYLDAFLKGFILRDSCYHCRYAASERVSDMTIGDFWGLGRKESADEIPEHPFGCSVVLPVTEKGARLLDEIRPFIECYPRRIQEAVEGNAQLQGPVRMNRRIRAYRKIQRLILMPSLYRWIHLDKMLIRNR